MEEVDIPQIVPVVLPNDVTSLAGHKADYNPREMSEHDFKALKRSIQEFGDLSGIVLNRQTGNIVGGHRRVDTFMAVAATAPITIIEELESPSSSGTVARGWVQLGDEKFSYRIVDWPLAYEQAANIAANRIQGEFDNGMLADLIAEIEAADASLLELTGNTEKQIAKLLQMSSSPETEPPTDEKPNKEQMTFGMTAEQAAVVQQALDLCKSTHTIAATDNDNVNGNALYFIAREWLDATPTYAPQPGAISVTENVPTDSQIVTDSSLLPTDFSVTLPIQGE